MHKELYALSQRSTTIVHEELLQFPDAHHAIRMCAASCLLETVVNPHHKLPSPKCAEHRLSGGVETLRRPGQPMSFIQPTDPLHSTHTRPFVDASDPSVRDRDGRTLKSRMVYYSVKHYVDLHRAIIYEDTRLVLQIIEFTLEEAMSYKPVPLPADSPRHHEWLRLRADVYVQANLLSFAHHPIHLRRFLKCKNSAPYIEECAQDVHTTTSSESGIRTTSDEPLVREGWNLQGAALDTARNIFLVSITSRTVHSNLSRVPRAHRMSLGERHLPCPTQHSAPMTNRQGGDAEPSHSPELNSPEEGVPLHRSTLTGPCAVDSTSPPTSADRSSSVETLTAATVTPTRIVDVAPSLRELTSIPAAGRLDFHKQPLCLQLALARLFGPAKAEAVLYHMTEYWTMNPAGQRVLQATSHWWLEAMGHSACPGEPHLTWHLHHEVRRCEDTANSSPGEGTPYAETPYYRDIREQACSSEKRPVEQTLVVEVVSEPCSKDQCFCIRCRYQPCRCATQPGPHSPAVQSPAPEQPLQTGSATPQPAAMPPLVAHALESAMPAHQDKLTPFGTQSHLRQLAKTYERGRYIALRPPVHRKEYNLDRTGRRGKSRLTPYEQQLTETGELELFLDIGLRAAREVIPPGTRERRDNTPSLYAPDSDLAMLSRIYERARLRVLDPEAHEAMLVLETTYPMCQRLTVLEQRSGIRIKYMMMAYEVGLYAPAQKRQQSSTFGHPGPYRAEELPPMKRQVAGYAPSVLLEGTDGAKLASTPCHERPRSPDRHPTVAAEDASEGQLTLQYPDDDRFQVLTAEQSASVHLYRKPGYKSQGQVGPKARDWTQLRTPRDVIATRDPPMRERTSRIPSQTYLGNTQRGWTSRVLRGRRATPPRESQGPSPAVATHSQRWAHATSTTAYRHRTMASRPRPAWLRATSAPAWPRATSPPQPPSPSTTFAGSTSPTQTWVPPAYRLAIVIAKSAAHSLQYTHLPKEAYTQLSNSLETLSLWPHPSAIGNASPPPSPPGSPPPLPLTLRAPWGTLPQSQEPDPTTPSPTAPERQQNRYRWISSLFKPLVEAVTAAFPKAVRALAIEPSRAMTCLEPVVSPPPSPPSRQPPSLYISPERQARRDAETPAERREREARRAAIPTEEWERRAASRKRRAYQRIMQPTIGTQLEYWDGEWVKCTVKRHLKTKCEMRMADGSLKKIQLPGSDTFGPYWRPVTANSPASAGPSHEFGPPPGAGAPSPPPSPPPTRPPSPSARPPAADTPRLPPPLEPGDLMGDTPHTLAPTLNAAASIRAVIGANPIATTRDAVTDTPASTQPAYVEYVGNEPPAPWSQSPPQPPQRAASFARTVHTPLPPPLIPLVVTVVRSNTPAADTSSVVAIAPMASQSSIEGAQVALPSTSPSLPPASTEEPENSRSREEALLRAAQQTEALRRRAHLLERARDQARQASEEQAETNRQLLQEIHRLRAEQSSDRAVETHTLVAAPGGVAQAVPDSQEERSSSGHPTSGPPGSNVPEVHAADDTPHWLMLGEQSLRDLSSAPDAPPSSSSAAPPNPPRQPLPLPPQSNPLPQQSPPPPPSEPGTDGTSSEAGSRRSISSRTSSSRPQFCPPIDPALAEGWRDMIMEVEADVYLRCVSKKDLTSMVQDVWERPQLPAPLLLFDSFLESHGEALLSTTREAIRAGSYHRILGYLQNRVAKFGSDYFSPRRLSVIPDGPPSPGDSDSSSSDNDDDASHAGNSIRSGSWPHHRNNNPRATSHRPIAPGSSTTAIEYDPIALPTQIIPDSLVEESELGPHIKAVLGCARYDPTASVWTTRCLYSRELYDEHLAASSNIGRNGRQKDVLLGNIQDKMDIPSNLSHTDHKKVAKAWDEFRSTHVLMIRGCLSAGIAWPDVLRALLQRTDNRHPKGGHARLYMYHQAALKDYALNKFHVLAAEAHVFRLDHEFGQNTEYGRKSADVKFRTFVEREPTAEIVGLAREVINYYAEWKGTSRKTTVTNLTIAESESDSRDCVSKLAQVLRNDLADKNRGKELSRYLWDVWEEINLKVTHGLEEPNKRDLLKIAQVYLKAKEMQLARDKTSRSGARYAETDPYRPNETQQGREQHANPRRGRQVAFVGGSGASPDSGNDTDGEDEGMATRLAALMQTDTRANSADGAAQPGRYSRDQSTRPPLPQMHGFRSCRPPNGSTGHPDRKPWDEKSWVLCKVNLKKLDSFVAQHPKEAKAFYSDNGTPRRLSHPSCKRQGDNSFFPNACAYCMTRHKGTGDELDEKHEHNWKKGTGIGAHSFAACHPLKRYVAEGGEKSWDQSTKAELQSCISLDRFINSSRK